MSERASSSDFLRSVPVRYNRSGFPGVRDWRSEGPGAAGPATKPGSFRPPLHAPLARIAGLSWKRGIMRTRHVVIIVLALLVAVATGTGTLFAAALPAQDQEQNPDASQGQSPDQNPDQGAEQYQNFSPDQLDNLLGPIALYPDPLLAQVLVAATFPDQIDEAARFLRAGANPDAVDDQPWDVSVKSVAHYPTVLYMMDNRLDWTTSIGQAYVNQSTDVQASIQRLRAMAYNAGTLVNTPELQVVQDGPYWQIWPANPQLIYVPVYDPAYVFFGRPGWRGPYITFGAGYPIGAWLNLSFGWGGPGVYYFGWGGVLPPWAVRARPFIRINRVYVNDRYRTVNVNRAVLRRTVNYDNLNRYNGVHRDVNYSNLGNRRFAGGGERTAPNQIVQRNIDTRDSRIQEFRGRTNQGNVRTFEGQGTPAPPERMRPEESQPNRAGTGRPAPQRARPVPPPQARTNEQPSRPSAFNSERGAFDPRQASQRGQASRQEMSRPAPQPRQAPAARPSGGRGKP